MSFLATLQFLIQEASAFFSKLMFLAVQQIPLGTTSGLNPDEDIHDVKGLWIPDYSKIYYGILILVGLVAAIILGIWLYKKWKKGRIRIRSLSEATFEQLEGARAVIREGNAREFSGRVSNIIRNYIELRFHRKVTHQTTEEFLRTLALGGDEVLEPHSALLTDFLQYCDLVKFARSELSVEQMGLMLASAKRFVEATTPQPVKNKEDEK